MQVNRQKTIVKKKITYFLNNYFASLFKFFEKVFAICKFFDAWRLDVRFYLFEVQSTVLISSSSQGREFVDLVVTFNKGSEETFAVSLLN